MINYFVKKHFFYSLIFALLLISVIVIIVPVFFNLSTAEVVPSSTTSSTVNEAIPGAVEGNLSVTTTNTYSATKEVLPVHELATVTATSVITSLINQNDSIPTMTLTTSPIYLIAQQGITTAEVWQSSVNDTEWVMRYHSTKSVDTPIDTVIPPQEIEELQTALETYSPPIVASINELEFESRIWHLTLSPTKEKLVSQDRVAYCLEEFRYCFGIWRITNFNLVTNQSQLILQKPIDDNVSLNNLMWSPNSQYLAFGDYTRGKNNSLVIINIKTGELAELASEIDLEGPLAWSPDSTIIALYLSRWHVQGSGGVIRLCTVESGICQDIELDGLWVHQNGMDWSPDGKQIIFAAVDADPNLFSGRPVDLYLMDLETKVVQKVVIEPAGGVLEDPKWSPDGQFIAASYSEKTEDNPHSVIVIESLSGQVVNQLLVEDCIREWTWGADSHSIWQLVCHQEFRHSLKVTNVQDLSSKLMALPETLQNKWIGFNSLSLKGGTYTR